MGHFGWEMSARVYDRAIIAYLPCPSRAKIRRPIFEKIMETPDRVITLPELRRNTGDRSTRKWVAYNGVVYDVTDCPRWHKEMHENLHFPGQDLSSELVDAPHSDSVFLRSCVKIVGRFTE